MLNMHYIIDVTWSPLMSKASLRENSLFNPIISPVALWFSSASSVVVFIPGDGIFSATFVSWLNT
jgi:hypothetical protein